MSKRQDVKAARLPALKWDDDSTIASLDTIFNHAMEHGEQVIDWYLKSKHNKKNCAHALRIAAIVLTTVGGLIPVLAETETFSYVEPIWSTILLAIAGALVAFDRFFGCSSAWMRFITAEHAVRQHLNEFQIECEQLKAGWEGTKPNDTELQKALETAKHFIVNVDEIVREETAQWRAEFQSTIKEIDGKLKPPSK